MTLIQVARAVLPVPEWGTYTGVLRARFAGKSWWSLRFTDGTIVNEWDSDPGSPNKHADWPRVRYQGRQALRLYCPNGQVAHVGDTVDATGRLVQFKVGLRTVGMGGGAIAHVIGIIEGTDGQCRFYSWERLPDGSGVLNGWPNGFEDNVNRMVYHNIGALSTDHLGLSSTN